MDTNSAFTLSLLLSITLLVYYEFHDEWITLIRYYRLITLTFSSQTDGEDHNNNNNNAESAQTRLRNRDKRLNFSGFHSRWKRGSNTALITMNAIS